MKHELHWFVARFASGHELEAAKAIDSPVARAFCPLEHRRWVVKGTQHERLFPVLAGYIFVEMQPGDSHRWHAVAALKGFYGFIGGATPQPARDTDIEALIDRSTENWVLERPESKGDKVWFSRGDRVRITLGPLENCLGRIEWTRSRQDGPVAQVHTTGFFGIEMRVELSLDYLERVEKQKKKPVESLLELPVIRR